MGEGPVLARELAEDRATPTVAIFGGCPLMVQELTVGDHV